MAFEKSDAIARGILISGVLRSLPLFRARGIAVGELASALAEWVGCLWGECRDLQPKYDAYRSGASGEVAGVFAQVRASHRQAPLQCHLHRAGALVTAGGADCAEPAFHPTFGVCLAFLCSLFTPQRLID